MTEFKRVDLGGVNVAASNTTYTSGTVILSGGANVTVGTNGQTVTISAAAGGGGGTFSAGVSTGGNTAGSTGITGTRLVFVGTNAVSLSQSTDANGGTVSINAPTQSAQTFVGGLAGSNTTYTSGTITITGVGGGITVSSNTGQRIDLSVAAPVAQTNQSGGIYAVGNTTGQSSSSTHDARTLSVDGAGMVSVGWSNSTLRISATQTVQTQTHNVTVGGNSTSAGAGYVQISTGTMTLAGGNNITLSQNGNAVTISGAAAGGAQTGISGIANSETTYTSGSVTLSALGAVTIRSTTGQQFQISVNSQTAQTGISGIANSQTTYTSGTVSLSELGAITIRSTTGNQYQFSVNSQTVQTQDVLSVGASNIGNTAGNTTVNTGSRMVLAGGNNITVSQSTAAGATTLTISAPNAQTGISGIANSQTTYTSGTVSLSELGAITIRSTTGNQYQFSVNSQTNQQMTLYATSNTTQSSTGTTNASSMVFAGAGVASVGITNGSVLISVPAGGGGGGIGAGVSTMGNTAGSTGTITTGNLVLVGTGAVTLSQSTGAAGSAATVSVSVPQTSLLSATADISLNTNGSTISIGRRPVSIYEANSAAFYSSALAAMINTSVSIMQMVVPLQITFTKVQLPISVSLATSAATNTAAHAMSKVMVLYTRDGSTLNPLVGTSQTETFSWASNTGVYSSLTGPRFLTFPLATMLTPGEYFLAVQLSSNTSSVGANTTNLGGTYSPIFGTTYTVLGWREMSAATAQTSNAYKFMQGMKSIAITNTTMTHQASQITQTGATGIRGNLAPIFLG